MHAVDFESRRFLFSSRCLTTGLPRDSNVYEETRAFDESAYRHYETVRERLVQLFEDITIQYLRTPFVANRDEVSCKFYLPFQSPFDSIRFPLPRLNALKRSLILANNWRMKRRNKHTFCSIRRTMATIPRTKPVPSQSTSIRLGLPFIFQLI